MTQYDRLLAWASESGSGRRAEFTRACRVLQLPAVEAMRSLEMLGHVEFAAERWACAPATLSTMPGVPERLLLSGQRPAGLLERLRTVADQGDHELLVEQEGIPQARGPATILLSGTTAAAPAFCDEAGIRFCPAAHVRLAELLPVAELDRVAQRAVPDLRFPHCPLDPVTLCEQWDAKTPEGEEGLWVFREWGSRPVRYLRRGGDWWRFDDPGWAAYVADAPEEPWCRFEPANRLLVVNTAAGLPRLAARAAALCSGRAPVRMHLTTEVAEDHYVGVDRRTAETVLASLASGGSPR